MRRRALILLVLPLLAAGLRAFPQDSVRNDGFNRFRYPNGKVSSEGTLKNGKPDGYWKAYYETGIIKSEGNRKNFELDSAWKFYNPEGKLILEINYRNGKKNGMRTAWLDRETVKENYRDDVREGYARYYYADGKLKQEIPYVKGLEQGFGREYATDGTIMTLIEYKKGFVVDRMRINRKDGNGKKQGRWCTFWDNGNLRTETGYRDDLRNGYMKEYAENGDLLKVVKYVNDEPEVTAEEIRKLDVTNEYYPNGKVKISAMFRDGVPEGVRREYDEQGTVVKALVYHNGIVLSEGIVLDDGNRSGPWKDFYPDGSLKAEGKYENGKQTGTWKYYYPDGRTEQTGKFSRGKADGEWKWYYPDGSVLREESYRAGKRDGVSTEYDEAGNIVQQGDFLEDLEDGVWFSITGDTYTRGTYRDGMRNGLWTSWYLNRNGSVTDSVCFFKGSFIDDNPDGKHITYWENGKIKEEGLYVGGRKEGDWYLYNSDGTLFLVITYRQGAEIKFDGVKLKPPFEKEDN